MKVTTEVLERCETQLTIEFDAKKEQDMLEKAAKRIAREVRIPGFRPGKAPYNTIVRRFGLEAIQQEMLEKMSDNIVKDALAEAKIEPFAQIKLDEVTWSPLVIKLTVPTEPKVELADYRHLRLDSEPVEVVEADVDEKLKSLQEQNATWTPVERPAEMGDLVSMTVTEADGDKVLLDNEATDFELTPPKADSQTPDLVTPLIGLNAGENKTFTVNYPEDFDNEDYAGKEITITVAISSVKTKELDPLDDDFAQQVSQYETLAELRSAVEADLVKQRERNRDVKLGGEMLEQLIASAPALEWPVALEEEELDHEVEQTEHQLSHMGLTLDGYLEMLKKTREQWRNDTRETVVNRLKRSLVLGKVAELEKLEVKQSEILEQAKAISDYTGGGDAMWRSILSSATQQGMIANDLISNKAIMRLAAIARGETFEPETPVAEAETVEIEAAPPENADNEAAE